MIRGPGLSITFTLVPLGPVPINFCLRVLARFEFLVEGTMIVAVAPSALNQFVLSALKISALWAFEQ